MKQFKYRLLIITLLLCLGLCHCGQPTPPPVTAGIELSCDQQQITAFQGEKVTLNIELLNHSRETIRPENHYFISYHLYDLDHRLVAFENRRFPIPGVLRRLKKSAFPLVLFFNYRPPGLYIVELDIVKEGEFWGSQRGWKTHSLQLQLKPLISSEFKERYLPSLISTSQPLLDQEQYLLRLTLKNSEMFYPPSSSRLFGFSAGSDYPAVWIRDTATYISYAKRYYSFHQLAPIVELFFQYQYDDASVPDWVNPAGQTDKNTVETDQESSLVLAAFALGQDQPLWWRKIIKGKTLIERMDEALTWVWQNKRDLNYNLVVSAFTADWGDIDNSFPDQRATKLSHHSMLVLSTYTQARYIQAIAALVNMYEMLDGSGYREKIILWQQRMDMIKVNTKKYLYLPDRGYFITHIVLHEDREKYFQMERDMLAVGGNAEAMIAGLMSPIEIQRFLTVLEARRQQYRLRTVSFTLLPPYPAGFFSHHLLAHPWNYQNGGEWDWIGARVIKGLLLNQFKKEAEVYLLEIVKKNLANFCIYEWEDRQGVGRGALFYTGAAGILGEVISLYSSAHPVTKVDSQ